MKDEALCCVGLLKGRNQLPGLLELLPELRRSATREKMTALLPLAEGELRSRLKRLRDSQLEEIWSQAEKEAGDSWGKVSPRIRRWISQAVRRSHGE